MGKRGVNFTTFCSIMDKNFDVGVEICACLFERFKPLPPVDINVEAASPSVATGAKSPLLKEKVSGIQHYETDVLDVLLALDLLSKIVQPLKIKMMFDICDQDLDGVLSADELLDMLRRVERIFSQEESQQTLQQVALSRFIADRKAKLSCEFIIGMTKQ